MIIEAFVVMELVIEIFVFIMMLTKVEFVTKKIYVDNNPIWGKKLSKSNIVQQQQTTEVFFESASFVSLKYIVTELNRTVLKKAPLRDTIKLWRATTDPSLLWGKLFYGHIG